MNDLGVDLLAQNFTIGGKRQLEDKTRYYETVAFCFQDLMALTELKERSAEEAQQAPRVEEGRLDEMGPKGSEV